MAKRYEGGEDATPRRVVRYLIEHYEIDEVAATKLVADDPGGELAKGALLGSMAYYVGDKLARVAELVERDDPDADDDDDDDDYDDDDDEG